MNTKIILLFFLCLLIGCGENLTITPQEKKQAQIIGQESSTTVLRVMMMKLMEEIQQGGTVKAAKFCSVHAQELTSQIQEKFTKKITIKRTSQKNRNQKNTPNNEEKQALKFFVEEIKTKKQAPSHHLVKVRLDDQLFINYYKPLYVAPLCIQCHGSEVNLKPELKKMLKEKYPNDKAVNFKKGDFRGVLKISIPVAELK
ncbi:DUF3365 domain-containing protein [Candidatus Uabimicrobium sp. HlEnr_7]|uniref:Tll0287-like domain-containing protein n=1 Tax=Candidatus Uabimicrobium helgolandensis TaxID=3095367 RepID=UPI00355803E8